MLDTLLFVLHHHSTIIIDCIHVPEFNIQTQVLDGTGLDTDEIVDAIMDAANTTGLNPLFLAAAARGSGGASANPLAIKGAPCKGTRCYNALNLVGTLGGDSRNPDSFDEFCTTSGTGSAQANAAALALAEQEGWTSAAESIQGGADLLTVVGLQRLFSPDGPPMLTPQLAGVAEAIIGLEGIGGVRPRFTIQGLQQLQSVLVEVAANNPSIFTFVLPIYPDLPRTFFGVA